MGRGSYFPVIACTFHSVAIASTIFRLGYRWYMASFWWEDGWAMFALVVDVLCLVATWLNEPATGADDISNTTRVCSTHLSSPRIAAHRQHRQLDSCYRVSLCSLVRI